MCVCKLLRKELGIYFPYTKELHYFRSNKIWKRVFEQFHYLNCCLAIFNNMMDYQNARQFMKLGTKLQGCFCYVNVNKLFT